MTDRRRPFRRRRRYYERYMHPMQYPVILIQQPEPVQRVGGSGLIIGLLVGLLVLSAIKK